MRNKTVFFNRLQKRRGFLNYTYPSLELNWIGEKPRKMRVNLVNHTNNTRRVLRYMELRWKCLRRPSYCQDPASIDYHFFRVGILTTSWKMLLILAPTITEVKQTCIDKINIVHLHFHWLIIYIIFFVLLILCKTPNLWAHKYSSVGFTSVKKKRMPNCPRKRRLHTWGIRIN